MTIYRVISKTPFADGRVEGDLIFAGDYSEKTMAGLIKNNRIAAASTPPLRVLPGFTVIAEKLSPHGIINVEQFMEADKAVLMEHMGWKDEATVGRWRDRAAAALCVPGQKVAPQRR